MSSAWLADESIKPFFSTNYGYFDATTVIKEEVLGYDRTKSNSEWNKNYILCIVKIVSSLFIWVLRYLIGTYDQLNRHGQNAQLLNMDKTYEIIIMFKIYSHPKTP